MWNSWGANFRFYPNMQVEGVRKPAENLCHDSRSPYQYLKPGPSEYEAELLYPWGSAVPLRADCMRSWPHSACSCASILAEITNSVTGLGLNSNVHKLFGTKAEWWHVLNKRAGSAVVDPLCGSVQMNLLVFAHASCTTQPLAYQETKKLFFSLVIARKQPKSIDQGPNLQHQTRPQRLLWVSIDIQDNLLFKVTCNMMN
jgi:hypothetical protein